MSETTEPMTEDVPVDAPQAVATEEAHEVGASDTPADVDVDQTITAEASDTVADAPGADTLVEPVVAASGVASVRQARVFLCERGHRVTALWRLPTVCPSKITRTGPPCGLPLYAIGELPEQVQKALNPLKASKKSSKKK